MNLRQRTDDGIIASAVLEFIRRKDMQGKTEAELEEAIAKEWPNLRMREYPAVWSRKTAAKTPIYLLGTHS